MEYKPKEWLFEGEKGGRYSATSIVLAPGTDLRYIQTLLGHNGSRTTEIYTHVANPILSGIENPLDS